MIGDIIKKALGATSIILIVLGTVGNALIIYFCLKKRLRTLNTFKFYLFMAISDALSLYEWNLDHFVATFFKIDFNTTSAMWCKLNF